MSARWGARARFLPPAPSTSCRLRSREKGRRKKLGSNSSASGGGRAGAGRLARGSGTAAPPASPPPPAPARPRRARRERRPHRREQSASLRARRRQPARGQTRARWVGGRESARGAAWGGGGGGANTRRGGRPKPSRPWRRWPRSSEPAARGSRGTPVAPKCGRTRRKGAGLGRARAGDRGTPPCRAGPAVGGGIIATLIRDPNSRPRSPPPQACRGPGGGGGRQVAPERRGCAVPPRRAGCERERPRWLEAERSAGEEGGRRGTRCLFASHRGRGPVGARAGRDGARCGVGEAARGERHGEGATGWRGQGTGQEALGKEPPAPSSHHSRAAFLRMALPRGAPRRGSAPQTLARQPAL